MLLALDDRAAKEGTTIMSWDDILQAMSYIILAVTAALVGYAAVWVWKSLLQ